MDKICLNRKYVNINVKFIKISTHCVVSEISDTKGKLEQVNTPLDSAQISLGVKCHVGEKIRVNTETFGTLVIK